MDDKSQTVQKEREAAKPTEKPKRGRGRPRK